MEVPMCLLIIGLVGDQRALPLGVAMLCIIPERLHIVVGLPGPLCVLEVIVSPAVTRPGEHFCDGGSAAAHALRISLLSESCIERNLPCQDEVRMLLQTEVSIDFH